MIVSRRKFPTIIKELSGPGIYGLDTETTGLFEGDTLFSVILSNAFDNYYFNFLEYPLLAQNLILPREWIRELAPIFNKDVIFSISNPKFDMRMLVKEGLDVSRCQIHSTGCTERLLKNNYFGDRPYGLDACASRRGFPKKVGDVMDYINKHKLYENIKIPGKKRTFKKMHFDKVPFEIITNYAEHDGFLHRAVGVDQLEELHKVDATRYTSQPSILPLYENEMRVVKTCFRMERRGVLIDTKYCQAALEYEQSEQLNKRLKFLQATGEDYVNSNVLFARVFDSLGLEYSRNPPTELMVKKGKEKGIPAHKILGNPTFKAEILETIDHPMAKLISAERRHAKYKEYYSNFLFHAQEGVIHANIRNSGTNTGRMSMSDPSLHNVPKEDDPEDQENKFQVRGAFIPRKGFLFGMLDYDQMEYRMMMDYAGEKKVIKEILQGEDVHQVVADMLKVTRKRAKTINFGILYGQGIPSLAESLKVTEREARVIKSQYYSKLPKVKKLIDTVRATGKDRAHVWNWFGRKCYIDDPGDAYKLPNHLIQGGCADVMKIAMNRVDQMLLDVKARSGIAIQVHDELVDEIHKNEIELLPKIKDIMESVYPARNGMILTAGIDHSYKSWAYRDKVEGMPK